MKVRFHILSDLHIDSYIRRGLPSGEIPDTACDAIIVAGDTANGDMGIRWLIEQADRLQKPMFVIAGNHEYFAEDIDTFDHHLKQLTKSTLVTMLQCDTIDFKGVRVLGATMWTDYQYQANQFSIDEAALLMRDYKEIYKAHQLFMPQDSISIHQQHRQWLINELQQAYVAQKPTVVLTHHSISPHSISARYKNLPSNAAFVTDFSDILAAKIAPKLWVHGHTHEAFDYIQDNTRVVVNPRAYPNEVSSTDLQFDWAKVVEIMV